MEVSTQNILKEHICKSGNWECKVAGSRSPGVLRGTAQREVMEAFHNGRVAQGHSYLV